MDGLLPLGPVAMNLLVNLTRGGTACAPLPSAVCSTGGGSLSSGCWYNIPLLPPLPGCGRNARVLAIARELAAAAPQVKTTSRTRSHRRTRGPCNAAAPRWDRCHFMGEGELTPQVGVSESSNCKSGYDNECHKTSATNSFGQT